MSRLTPVLFLLVLCSLAVAQPPPQPPGAPFAPAVGDMVRLQFPNTDVKDVLSFYERLTKKKLILDNQIQGNVNIVIAGEVPREEAVRIIEISLLLNGYTLIPVERSNLVKVIGVGKNPRSAAIPIISDEALLPDGEQVVTFLKKLQYADALELQQTLGTFIVPAQGQFTNLTALPKAQAILITENTATIRGVLRIINEIDVPPAEVVSEFIVLERADAKDVLEKLTAIFEKTPTAGGVPSAPGGVPRAIPRAVPVATPEGNPLPPGATAEVTSPNSVEISGSLSEDSIIVGKIKLTADIRTNRIHVVTRPVNLPFIRKLINEFDSNARFGEAVSRPLRYVSAADVLDTVVKAITEPGMKEDASSATGTTGNRTGQTGGGGGGGGTLFNTGGNSGSGGGGGTGGSVSEGLSTEPVDTMPEARVVGTTKIIADKNANSIIVIGNADAKAKVFKLLDYLDQRIPQVMLHTVIGELNLTDRVQFGVDYVIRNAGLGMSPINVSSNTTTTNPDGTTTTPGMTGTVGGNGTGTGTGTVIGTGTAAVATARATDFVTIGGGSPLLNRDNLLNQNRIAQIAGAGGGGVTAFLTAGNSLTAIVTALQNTNRFHVVSRPSVFTRNNKKAVIASGQEIAVPVNIQSSVNSVTAGNAGLVTNSSVQFKTVALQLEVVPLINSDKEVSLDILQKEDQVSGSTRIDNNDIPTIATRYVRTSVTVPNEATLVLGGLIKVNTNNVKSGIPFLSNIPLLGYLFSNTSKEKTRSELVILIRPVVSWAPVDSIKIRERAQEYLNIEPDLESTVYPTKIRKKLPPEDMLRKPSVPLRERSAAPSFRK